MKDNYLSNAVDSVMLDFVRCRLTQQEAINVLEDYLQLNMFDNAPISEESARYVKLALAEVRRS